MIYIFIYNVISIKSDFIRLKSLSKAEKFILIASNYCLQHLSTKNRPCFDEIHPISRNFHNVDYDSVKQIVDTYVQKYGAKNIRLLTNEDSTQISCAKIREFYNIPGDLLKDVLPFVNKIISKKRLKNTVNTPKFVLFNKLQYAEKQENYLKKLAKKLEFPMFAKPIDMVSSIGAYKVDTFSDLKIIADKMLIDVYEFEVEEFIDGKLFHCDLILDNGNIKFFMMGEYAFPLVKFSQGFPMGSIPVTAQKTQKNLFEFTKKVVQKLKFKKGGLHLEVFFRMKSKDFVFLEISARTPGAMLPKSYEVQFGINVEEWHYLAHMDLLSNFKPAIANKFGGWISFPTISGMVADIEKPKIEIQHEFIEYVSVGQVIQNSKSLLDVSCSIVFWDKDMSKVETAFEKLKNFRPLKIENTIPIFSDFPRDKLKLDLDNHFEIMEELFNAMPYVFWKDRNGRYRGCNLNQVKAFHFNSVPDFIGRTVFELLPDPESARIVDETDNAIMDSGKMVVLEETLVTPEGIKTYLSQKQPLFDNDGAVIGMLGFAVDITEIKEQERLAKEQSEKLTQEKHQLEIDHYKQLSEEQEKFTKLANKVAHDIRSPLASLTTIVKNCTQLPESSRIALREAAITISDIANHLLHQYQKRELTDLTEFEERQAILVSMALLETLTAKKYQYANKPVKLDYHFDTNTYFAFIKIQPSAFKRMLSNIINNAVDALENKPGKIDLCLDTDNEWVKITIDDTGKGMSSKLVDKILRKIAVTEGKKLGHGIGFSQVWETLDNNQGELAIVSEPGKGTCMTLTFPRVTPPHWIAEEIVLKPNDIIVILDDDASIHGAWNARLEMFLNENIPIQLKHFHQGKEALAFIQDLSLTEKERVFLLSDYELLEQELHGLHIIAKSAVLRSMLVTSHYADPLVQTQAMKIGTKILPKQLASEIVIKMMKTDEAEKIDAVIVDDDKTFVNMLLLHVFSTQNTAEYHKPEDLFKNLHKYAKDTKIFLDNNYNTSDLKGIDVAKELYQRGYQRLYLLSGEAFSVGEVPSYLTVIEKTDVEHLKEIVNQSHPG